MGHVVDETMIIRSDPHRSPALSLLFFSHFPPLPSPFLPSLHYFPYLHILPLFLPSSYFLTPILPLSLPSPPPLFSGLVVAISQSRSLRLRLPPPHLPPPSPTSPATPLHASAVRLRYAFAFRRVMRLLASTLSLWNFCLTLPSGFFLLHLSAFF